MDGHLRLASLDRLKKVDLKVSNTFQRSLLFFSRYKMIIIKYKLYHETQCTESKNTEIMYQHGYDKQLTD